MAGAAYARQVTVTNGKTGPAGPRGPAGPPGPVGPQGPAGVLQYVAFTQSIAAAVWTITHGLSRRPIITLYDADDNEISGDITYPNATTVIVTFSLPLNGSALLI